MLRFISDFDWIYLAVFEQLYVSLQQTQKKNVHNAKWCADGKICSRFVREIGGWKLFDLDSDNGVNNDELQNALEEEDFNSSF